MPEQFVKNITWSVEHFKQLTITEDGVEYSDISASADGRFVCKPGVKYACMNPVMLDGIQLVAGDVIWLTFKSKKRWGVRIERASRYSRDEVAA